MKKHLILYILLILILGNTQAFAKGVFPSASKNMTKEESVFVAENNAEVNTDNKNKSIWNIFKKNNNSQSTVNSTAKNENNINNLDTKGWNDEILLEKKQAVEDANNVLSDKYFKNTNTFDNIIDGQIQKTDGTAENPKVDGYIHETVILSLDDCIRNALQNNPQIRSAFNNSEIYKTKIGQAWSNYFPTFSINSGYTRNRFFAMNFEVEEKLYNYFNAANMSASWLLFDFGKTKALADVSKRTYESTLANLDETINEIVYSVKEAYYALLYALEKENVYLDSVKSYELQLRQAESFYVIGTKPKIDVTMAQYNLGNAQLGLVKATNEVTLATAQLNNAMGLPNEDDYKILDKLAMKKYDYAFEDLLTKAYSLRPQLLAFQKKAKASETLVRSTKRAFLPNIEAVGSYQLGGGGAFSDDYGWSIGAQLSYGTTNLMLLKKQVDEAKATHQKDLADLQVQEQNVYLEVKQAFVNLKNAKESIPITALSLKHAKEQYELASGRYKTGVGDAIELKDSEVTYRNARLDYLSALLQYNVSVANLEKVIGCTLEEKEIEE